MALIAPAHLRAWLTHAVTAAARLDGDSGPVREVGRLVRSFVRESEERANGTIAVMRAQPPVPLECGDTNVTLLLRFVEARHRESRPSTDHALQAAPADLDLENLTEELLATAREVCMPTRACGLPAGALKALRAVARLHEDHPEFEWGIESM